jgi:aspartate-semialdehyde dehydrogenase
MGYKVAVGGATGNVGRVFLQILEQRAFPVSEVKLLASARSAGKTLAFRGAEHTIEQMTEDSFDGMDLALFSCGGAVSKRFAPAAAKAGCVVIDNSSAWRMDPNCPLVVPEVNPDDVTWHKNIIANPNCSTIQMVVALKPLHDAATIRRVVVSTYQSVSGTGWAAVEECKRQSRQVLDGQEPTVEVYPHRIAFECLPQVDVFQDAGYTKEEWKMVHETHKILDERIALTATCVRVPSLVGHSESINIETERKLTADAARELLAGFPGVEVVDDPTRCEYPLTATAAGTDPVYVGRIREDNTIPNGLNLWCVSDNLRKGAALNTIQIAELLIERGLL